MLNISENDTNEDINQKLENHLNNQFSSIISKDDVKKISKLRRYSYYFLLTILISLIFIFMSIRTILFLRFDFKGIISALKVTDMAFKNHLGLI